MKRTNLRISGWLLVVSMLAGCGVPLYRPGDLPKNLTINLDLDAGGFLTRTSAAVGITHLSAACEADYRGYVDLVQGATELALAPGQRMLVVVEITNRSLGSRGGVQRGAMLTPRPGVRYQIDANYVDGMYDFRLYELTRAGKRALPVGQTC